MKQRSLSMPEIFLIAATRGMGGAGLGLLLADRMSQRRRKAVGWSLFLIGAASTIPILRHVLHKESVDLMEERERVAMH